MKAKIAKIIRRLDTRLALTLGTLVLMSIVTVVGSILCTKLLYTQVMVCHYRGTIEDIEYLRDYYEEMATSYPQANFQSAADEMDAMILDLVSELNAFKDNTTDPIVRWAFREDRDLFTICIGISGFLTLALAWWLLNRFTSQIISFEFELFKFILYWLGTVGAFVFNQSYLLCDALKTRNQYRVRPIIALKCHIMARHEVADSIENNSTDVSFSDENGVG